MDINFWIRCNPKITVEHTTKKYYNQYLYKIVVYCPAGRLIDSKESLDKALEHRKSVYKHINQSGWWGARQNRDLDHADIFLLEKLRSIRKNSNNFKMRVEEPRIQIYANTEDELVNLILEHLQPFVTAIESVSGPVNDECADLLNSGAILRKKDIGYRYKIVLRDGRYTAEVKVQLLNYLTNLGDDTAHLTKSVDAMLRKSNSFLWNAYFYANDPAVGDFINLISPGIIGNIHELVVVPHK